MYCIVESRPISTRPVHLVPYIIVEIVIVVQQKPFALFKLVDQWRGALVELQDGLIRCNLQKTIVVNWRSMFKTTNPRNQRRLGWFC